MSTYEALVIALDLIGEAAAAEDVESLAAQCLEHQPKIFTKANELKFEVNDLQLEVEELSVALIDAEAKYRAAIEKAKAVHDAISRYRIWAGITPCPGQLKLLEV